MIPPRSNGKHPGGRPSKYDPSYPSRLIAFFSERKLYTVVKGTRLASDPPILFDFSEAIGVWPQTLYDWEAVHPEFHAALEWWRAFSKKYLVTCGLLGLTNSAITTLELKNNHGYRDRFPEEVPKVGISIHYGHQPRPGDLASLQRVVVTHPDGAHDVDAAA